LHQGHQDGEKRAALAGEAVLETAAAIGRCGAFEDAAGDQFLEPRRQDIARDAEVLLEVMKAVRAEEGLAQDEHRPQFADQFEGAGDRTIHPSEGLAPHGNRLLQKDCIEQPNGAEPALAG